MRLQRETLTRPLGVLIRLAILLALLAVTVQDVNAFRQTTRGRESGLSPDLPPLESSRLAIGVALEQYETNVDLLNALAFARGLGYGTLVQHFSWAQIEPAPGEFDWVFWDRTLALVREQGFEIVAVLEGAPAWARAEYEQDNPLAPPANPEDYARFAAAFADRFGNWIKAYQIWDQPNIYPHWGKGNIDPAGYVALLEAAAAAIRGVDSDAVIVAGGMAPNTERSGRNMSDVQFLREIYRLGGGPWFDVLGVKTYGFWTGAYDRRVDADVLNFSRTILLREELVSRGDARKPIWSLEGGWAALPEDWQGAAPPWGDDAPELQASRLKDAWTRVQREWPWMTLYGALHLQPAASAEDPLWGLSLLDPGGQPTPLMRALGSGLESEGYVPGRHRVTVPLLPESIPPEAERAVLITFYGTDLVLDMAPRSQPGELQVLAPSRRTVRLDASEDAQRVWIARGEPAGTHTVQIAGQVGALRQIQAVVVGNRPATGRLWGEVLAALALAVWLSAQIWRQLQHVDWRRPYRLADGLLAHLPDPWDTAALALVFALAMVAPGQMIRLGLLVVYGLGALLRPGAALMIATAAIPLGPVHVALGPGHFGISELAVVCAGLALGGATILGGARPRWVTTKRTRWVDLLLLAFVLWAGVGATRAEYQREALREFRTAVAEPALLYLLLRLTVHEERQWRALVDVFVASAVGTALYALLRYPTPGGVIEAEGVRRARGYFGSPNNLALYLERLLPLSVSLAATPGSSRRRLWYISSAVILLVTTILTFSRGAWLLGIPAGLLVVGLLQGKRSRRYVLAGLAVLAVCCVPLFRTERFSSLLNLQSGTSFLRLQLWQASWAMIRDQFWTGVGLDNFLYYYGDYILPGAEIERWLSHPHNIILDLWVRTGLIGLVLYMGAFLTAVLPTLRALTHSSALKNPVTIGLLGALAAALAHGLIDNAIFVPELAYGLLFVLAYLVHASTPLPPSGECPE